VDHAKDLSSGKIVAAEDASRWRSYECPRPGCGGSVFLRNGGSRRAHFAHRAGEGTEACDAYFPGGSGVGGEADTPAPAVEDSPSDLGLIVDQLDGEWRVGLRLPEIPRDEIGDASLSVLRPAGVEVSVGGTVVSRISALDLRSGVGAARVPVRPVVQEYRARAVGPWPSGINTERWQRQARGIDARGTLFRLRGGEWTRLVNGSGVHHGEGLIVLADDRSPPPASIVTQTHAHFPVGSAGPRWTLWGVRIPEEPVSGVTAWLHRLGHTLVPKPWSVDLATPPRARNERGAPVFWIGDTPVAVLQAPRCHAEAQMWLKAGTNSTTASVKATESGSAFVAIASQDVGPVRLTVAERGADIDVTFIQRPARAATLEQLTKTRRVRLWLGAVAIEAWRDSKTKVYLERALPDVRVDLGAEGARARVTAWERGKQRSSGGLDARGAERVIAEALPTASRIEVDANNFGRVEIVIARMAVERHERSSGSNRLAWFDHVASLSARPPENLTATILQQPRASTSLAIRSVGAAALVRSRQALRQRHEAGGDQ
jgi:hypothetical protein